MEYYTQALAIIYRLKDSAGIAKKLLGICITYDIQVKSDSALWYFNKALAINERNNYNLSIAENLTSIWITYKDLDRY